jgi:hypothetical protein
MGWSVVALTLVTAVYAAVNAQFIRVRTVEMSSPKIAAPLTIVHLSDIHFGAIHQREYLARVVNMTNSARPDVVCITGDLVDGHHQYTADMVAPLADIRAPVYFTTGNHERYAGLDRVLALLMNSTRMTILRNAAGFRDNIQIIGIDDDEHRTHVAEVLRAIPIDKKVFSILLYHRPQGMTAAFAAGVDLMLTGHVHGGQIAPFNFIVGLFFDPIRGFHQYGSSYLNVSTRPCAWARRAKLSCLKLFLHKHPNK